MHGISDDLWFIRSQTPAAMGPVQHRVSHTSSCSRSDVEGPAAWEGVSDGFPLDLPVTKNSPGWSPVKGHVIHTTSFRREKRV